MKLIGSTLFLVVSVTTTVFLSLIPFSSAFTRFEKCSTFSSDKCFEAKIKDVTVNIGRYGTNDDVTLEFCSDYDPNKCCKTPVLSTVLHDDWSKNDVESWGPRYLGPCANFNFKLRNGLTTTLKVKGSSSNLLVSSITITTVDPLASKKKNNETETFRCPSMSIVKRNGQSTKKCTTAPYKFHKIEKAVVKIGNDGTDDSVKVKICSDVNSFCCEKKLSRTFKDDWRKSKTEEWSASQFGNCGEAYFKVKFRPTITVSKTGNDDLKVESFNISFKKIGDKAATSTGSKNEAARGSGLRTINQPITTYKCRGFNLLGNCKVKTGKKCSTTLGACTRH